MNEEVKDKSVWFIHGIGVLVSEHWYEHDNRDVTTSGVIGLAL